METNERVLSRIERLLDRADQAEIAENWLEVKRLAEEVLVIDATNIEAASYLNSANNVKSSLSDRYVTRLGLEHYGKTRVVWVSVAVVSIIFVGLVVQLSTSEEGSQGDVGPAGADGIDGEAVGLPGPKGDKGDAGVIGVAGPAGVQGLAGTAGTAGATGSTGASIVRNIPASNVITTLDATGDVGEYTSFTIGADGLGLISYWDATNDDLKVAHCENAFCAPYFRRR